MKYINLLLLVFIFNYSIAQNNRQERIRSIKVAYITDQINLTVNQSEKFWPIYFEMESNLKAIKLSKPDIQNISDKEIESFIKNRFQNERKKIELQEMYTEKFLNVISPKQLLKLYFAEKSFRKELLKKLNNRNN